MVLSERDRERLLEAGFTLKQIETIERLGLVSPLEVPEEDLSEWWETYDTLYHE